MIILLSLLAADPVTTVNRVELRTMTIAAEPAAPRRSPYRLDPNIAGPADGKAGALATTGTQCAITGARLCTKKPRTVFSSSY